VPIDITQFKTVPKMLLNSPNNPGGFTNSAATITQTPKKEETKMEPTNSTITTVDALKAAYPDLVATIENAAATAERGRIKAIKDMALDGFESIVEDAMFENPVTAEAVAVKIVNEQRSRRRISQQPQRRC
jgi:hypothetical protein